MLQIQTRASLEKADTPMSYCRQRVLGELRVMVFVVLMAIIRRRYGKPYSIV